LYLSLNYPVSAQPIAQDSFYKGRTVTLMSHAAGGTYDGYLRLLARHMPKYIEGAPRMIVTHRPAGGGLEVVNVLGRVAPQDGTTLALVSQGMFLHEAIGGSGLQVSMGDLQWIGNFSQSNQVTIIWGKPEVKSINDAKHHQVVLGASGAAGGSAIPPVLYNSLLDTKFKLIYGYGATDTRIAVERGEVDGIGSIAWAAAKSFMAPLLKRPDATVLIQLGLRREADLPHVPLLIDLVQDDPDKLAIARFMALTSIIARALAAPPGMPEPRLSMLRNAFERVLTDPDFRAEANRANLDLDPMSGEEVSKAVSELLAAPESIIASVKTAMSNAPK
jgi:tripartite-type tricarboxylate transporter receptor subunit TctC